MTGCTLRAYGADFDVDAFLRRSPLCAGAVLRRGAPLRPGGRFVARSSGMAIEVSAAVALEDQLHDAERFLDGFADELDALRTWPGIERAWIDFAVPCRLGAEIAVQRETFPAGFLQALAARGLALELSVCERPDLDPRALLRAAVEKERRNDP